jgi:hypothetical protein
MEVSVMADPWSPEKRFVRLSLFKGLPNFVWYEKIYEFLSDEKQVANYLEQLALQASDLTSFKACLSRIEVANKFTSPVDIAKLENGGDFMNYIKVKRPLNDRGVPKETHGALTHRIQWAICAMSFQASLPGTLSIADLYAGLAHPNAHVARDRATDGTYIDVGSDSVSLWGILVDSPYLATTKKWQVYNARSPEFLMAYMESHKIPAIRQLHVFSENG